VTVEELSTWDSGCTSALGAACRNQVSPSVLAKRYGLPAAPVGLANGSMAVAEFQQVYWDQVGLDTFAKTCKVHNLSVAHMVGPNRPAICRVPFLGTEFCMEAMLDIEYIKSIGGSIPLTDVFEAQYSLEKWAQTILDMADGEAPLVHSISYGNDEIQRPNTPTYMRRVDADFMKLGLRGISVLVASGDQGVWGRTGPGFPKSNRFHPDFPAASAYVTSVGGTDFAVRNVVGDEKAWSDGGGGFSDTFATPAYQHAAVTAYLASNVSLPEPGCFNSSGRGYPDVSALGGMQNPYCVSVVALMVGVAGTSASSPVVAAILARLNALRLAKGKPPLGFANPFLYKHAEAFHDVTLGENKGTGPVGFKAAVGWDPATGLGTPDFGKLAALM